MQMWLSLLAHGVKPSGGVVIQMFQMDAGLSHMQVAEAQLARLLEVPIKRFEYSSRDTDAGELRAKVRTFVSGLLDDGTMVATGYHKYTDDSGNIQRRPRPMNMQGPGYSCCWIGLRLEITFRLG